MTTDHAALVGEWQRHFQAVLEGCLPPERDEPATLHQAMRYSTLGSGKRLRPVLTYAAGRVLGLAAESLDPLAVAIELIHAYSLIHDDLPAMDDDDLRRGRPTCHRAFDEATAILAGDALQALAFEVLARQLPGNPAGMAAISEIARACGSTGMAGGQALDLGAVGRTLDKASLQRMHRWKTGALIRAAVVTPSLVAEADSATRDSLGGYGDCIGLAFQVHDDILDVTGDTQRIGKTTQADALLDKPTFVSVLGLEESRGQALELRDEAIRRLQTVPGDTSTLAWLADYVVSRDR